MLMLSRVIRAFRELEGQDPRLEVGGRGSVAGDLPTDVEKGILVTLRGPGDRGEVLLWVSPRRGKLIARREGEDGARSRIQDRLLLHLEDRPLWGHTRFGSISDLVRALASLMHRRLVDLDVAPSAGSRSDAHEGGRPIVLVVEPDRDYGDVLSAFLEHDGFAVVRPRDPDDALDSVRRLRPVALLGEHPLRLRDGRSLCTAVRADPATASIPFLAITGRAGPEDLEDAARTHGEAVFAKPPDHTRVLSLLAELLDRPRPAH
ncbi:MAG: hypothetical protein GWM90_04905 [Gemmatimonadetes bacterium]|nr:response regulator [Gemmatimonadota bacterium]NIX43480.1 hypothetical protein [Gemmatimonadota bacterium]NIY07659.1 hypothetical protein [Gemmatimonadota bacterium]